MEQTPTGKQRFSMWNSWSSWSSPVGLGIFLFTAALAAAIVIYAVGNIVVALHQTAAPSEYMPSQEMPMQGDAVQPGAPEGAAAQ
jgi:hypothetical protein